MGSLATIVFAVVMLHLLLGFGYVMYKLIPEDKSKKD